MFLSQSLNNLFSEHSNAHIFHQLNYVFHIQLDHTLNNHKIEFAHFLTCHLVLIQLFRNHICKTIVLLLDQEDSHNLA